MTKTKTGTRIMTPAEIIAPGCGSPELLTRSPAHRPASSADLAHPVDRPHAHDAQRYPTRIGNRLHYRDGTVTDMDGNTVIGDAIGAMLSPEPGPAHPPAPIPSPAPSLPPATQAQDQTAAMAALSEAAKSTSRWIGNANLTLNEITALADSFWTINSIMRGATARANACQQAQPHGARHD